jgi:FAD synthetase
MKKTPAVKIMVFGTFDILHPGHKDFFYQAKRLAKNSQLIVSVARDVNVKRIKGSLPLYSEKQRLASVKRCAYVDKVVLGGLKNHLPHIIKENPDIIALGYDQSAYVVNLQKNLKERGILVKVVRLKPFSPRIYKSSLIKKQKVDQFSPKYDIIKKIIKNKYAKSKK